VKLFHFPEIRKDLQLANGLTDITHTVKKIFASFFQLDRVDAGPTFTQLIVKNALVLVIQVLMFKLIYDFAYFCHEIKLQLYTKTKHEFGFATLAFFNSKSISINNPNKTCK
jgi:hypothetical protein